MVKKSVLITPYGELSVKNFHYSANLSNETMYCITDIYLDNKYFGVLSNDGNGGQDDLLVKNEQLLNQYNKINEWLHKHYKNILGLYIPYTSSLICKKLVNYATNSNDNEEISYYYLDKENKFSYILKKIKFLS